MWTTRLKNLQASFVGRERGYVGTTDDESFSVGFCTVRQQSPLTYYPAPSRNLPQEGLVLDEILQRKRNKHAAKRLLRKLMKCHGLPKRMITDKLRSYGAAKRELTPGLEHRSHKGLNNRAENSHLPFRKRERCMQGFRSASGLQRYVACHSAVRNHFSVPARRRSANRIRYHRMEAFDMWKAAAGVA